MARTLSDGSDLHGEFDDLALLFGWDVTGFNLSSFANADLGTLLLLFLYQLLVPARRRVIR
jgi:hypothetical protein